jgi:hypothetical protein
MAARSNMTISQTRWLQCKEEVSAESGKERNIWVVETASFPAPEEFASNI